MDLEFICPRFTWRNNRREGETLFERIDRDLLNPEWRELFPFAAVFDELAVGFACCPIVLDADPKLAKPTTPFRFESMWTGGVWRYY